jgi:hypothetical protein
MLRNTDRIRFLFCGTNIPAETGLKGKLREATQAFAVLSILITIPPMIYFDFFFEAEEYTMVYIAYTFLDWVGPLLLLTGASFHEFTPTYIGYIIYSIFTLLELTLKLAFGLFVSFYYLSSDDDRRENFLIIYLCSWCVWVSLRVYFNYVFFSFVKKLGMALEFGDRGEHLNQSNTRVIREEKAFVRPDENNQYNQVIRISPSRTE